MKKLSVLLMLILLVSGTFAHPLQSEKGNKILINHLGYYPEGPKKAVISTQEGDQVADKFTVKNYETKEEVLTGKINKSGGVKEWKNWVFWTIDFSEVKKENKYYIEAKVNGNKLLSHPFKVKSNLLARYTLSDVIYYFKSERAVGQFKKADSKVPFEDNPEKTADCHGGWMDATGDYGKHLSHLNSATYFNPQQISLVPWSLFNVYEELDKRELDRYTQYKERLLDEAFHGADYMVRIHPEGSSFYQHVSAPGDEKKPEDRVVSKLNNQFTQESGQSQDIDKDKFPEDAKYCSSFRSGAGLSIASLARASTFEISGKFENEKYLKVAQDVFAHLQKYNEYYTNNGKENIIDDYTALLAAVELYKATEKDQYKNAATKRAQNLVDRLESDENYKNYWAANDKDRPFFHAADAGMVVVSLMHYIEIADDKMEKKVSSAVKKSMQHELKITSEVTNPFGYARQYVQNIDGERYSSFFIPHDTETQGWWQGENARLSSLVSAAKLTARYFKDDKEFCNKLERYINNQLNWILGLNPFDTCMLNGTGRNNPEYLFYSSWEYTNCPGGISNGITAGLNNQDDIDFHLTYAETGEDNDWRWAEQWLPHSAWYIYAISITY